VLAAQADEVRRHRERAAVALERITRCAEAARGTEFDASARRAIGPPGSAGIPE